MQDIEVIAFAKDLLLHYAASKSLLKALETSDKPPALAKAIRVLVRRLRISHALDKNEIVRLPNAHLAELFSILAFGIETGSNVEDALGLFIGGLQNKVSLNNRLRSKIGGTQALTKMGMCFFFPLFGSISSVILETTTSIIGGASSAAGGFLFLSCAYVPLILGLSAVFAHPENSLRKNLFSALPYSIIAFCIMLSVPKFIQHVL
ncbi:Uncharacterised protein [uncultured archaeon]|nr:Uncharacterised protein [uncultured archaeon]